MRVEEVLLDPQAVEAELLAALAETTQDRPRHLTPELRQAQPNLHCRAASVDAVEGHARPPPLMHGRSSAWQVAATVVQCTPSSPT